MGQDFEGLIGSSDLGWLMQFQPHGDWSSWGWLGIFLSAYGLRAAPPGLTHHTAWFGLPHNMAVSGQSGYLQAGSGPLPERSKMNGCFWPYHGNHATSHESQSIGYKQTPNLKGRELDLTSWWTRGKILVERLTWEILLWPSLENTDFNQIFIQALSKQIILQERDGMEFYQKIIQAIEKLLNFACLLNWF